MKSIYGYSNNENPKECVREATEKMEHPKFILYFSDVPNFEEYTRLIHERFPETCCIGSTTHVGLCGGEVFYQGLVVAGLEGNVIYSAGVIEDVDKKNDDASRMVEDCLFEMKAMDAIENTVCLEFCAALKSAEEQLLVALNSVLLYEDIKVFGGSAGDDYSAVKTLVSLEGKVYDNACVFVLLHNDNGAIHYYRENIFEPVTGKSFVVTKADALRRTVYELDHIPVLSVYAKELGMTEEEARQAIDLFPVGKVSGDEMYVISNKSVIGDGAFKYHARIHSGTNMMVLKAADYRKITSDTLNQIKREVPHPTFVLSCQCIARMILLKSEGYVEEYTHMQSEAFGGFIGFSGYGEQLGTRHFNETQCIMVFE